MESSYNNPPSATTAAAAAAPPPVPRQTRQHARRRSLQTPSTPHPPRTPDASKLPPASPEVISSLITSLSVITSPASNHFEGQPSPPGATGSFGVTYGSSANEHDEDVSLDELAACPPVIKTAKPPSGFSPLTAPKSPARDSSSGGLKSLLRNSSRPSSRGSVADDTHSIGNLSIERGTPPSHELRKQRSHDSWGRKTNRGSKGLMYMSSKERLREKESEKRSSFGTNGGGSVNGHRDSKPDPFLAETPINEEPGESSSHLRPDKSAIDASASPRPIPTRDSSLRKTGSNARRSSARNSRSKRESEHEVIHEGEEYRREQQHQQQPQAPPTRRHHSTPSQDNKSTDEFIMREMPEPKAGPSTMSRQLFEGTYFDSRDDDAEEGAPFPAVAQGRRRESSKDRRVSGQREPESQLRVKRSSSKLKRSSNPTSPLEPPRELAVSSPEPTVGYERPRSADSIDDAVESYLCSPRLSQKIRHPQTGRVISFSEVGDSNGFAVFCCVGMGLTRYITAFYDELALTLKLRLITPDRPGVGDSESYADGTATPLSWPDDVYAICQALKITKFSILAHSAGAIYALATALRMPQHIRSRIHLLAPWIPPSQMNVFGTSQSLPPTNAIPTSQRILRALPTPILKAANSSFMSATSSSITSSLPKTPRRKRAKKESSNNGRETPGHGHRHASGNSPGCDKENDPSPLPGPDATENMDRIRPTVSQQNMREKDRVLAAAADALADKERQMTYDTRLTHAIWDLATTGANPAVDLLVCLERRHTIGFRDTRVPVENVRWLGKTMRRCEVRVLEGEGHGLMASATVMGGVLMEISKEWEDWMRSKAGYEDGDDGVNGSSVGKGFDFFVILDSRDETVAPERHWRGVYWG
ncbi:hypothetical protein MKZ38_000254 [Zalerion maritima]|uniref:AB hydrolase-1 domain-containing protein n=1 Tax=Zalerion maritima TaxID=339359 RepID=A0AAD5RSI7_9PEZI|nr:hypothetical protein MKZ38_000254 [Zalerion maritima]